VKIIYRLIRGSQPRVESDMMGLGEAGFAEIGNGLDNGADLFLKIKDRESCDLQRAGFL
jgi:hypothetical protein